MFRKSMKKTVPILLFIFPWVLPAWADVTIVDETFSSYADGNLEGVTTALPNQWRWNNVNSRYSNTVSDWDVTSGAASVTGGVVSVNGEVKREWNGPTEGNGGSPNDNTETGGALRGNGVLRFQVDLQRSPGSTETGIASMNFTTRRVFFGVLSTQNGGAYQWGIEEAGNRVFTGIQADTNPHTLYAELNFNDNLLSLWVDDPSGAADATMVYNKSNWSTGIGLSSQGATATFDNLSVTKIAQQSILTLPPAIAGTLNCLNEDFYAYFPDDYTPSVDAPILFFLHGSGSRGAGWTGVNCSWCRGTVRLN